MIDTGPHLQVGNTRHPLLIWPLLFGRTSTGRKGEAWSTARRLLAAIDAVFAATNIETGMSSGEGLVERIKDVAAEDPDDDKGRRKAEWPGTPDKRLLVVEPEFGAVMARAKREGKTLASVMREAWDGRALAVLTKKRSRASTSHIAVISHVTPKEFRIRRAEADLAGGSYNRFLPVFVERSKSIPIGEGIAETDLRTLAATLRSAVQAAKAVTKISLDDQAKKLWDLGLVRGTDRRRPRGHRGRGVHPPGSAVLPTDRRAACSPEPARSGRRRRSERCCGFGPLLDRLSPLRAGADHR